MPYTINTIHPYCSMRLILFDGLMFDRLTLIDLTFDDLVFDEDLISDTWYLVSDIICTRYSIEGKR